MKKISATIVKLRFVILLAAFLLLIPSAIGYLHTRVNYDILTYLPQEIETMKGQEIMEEEFGSGAFSMFVVKGMEKKDLAGLRSRIENINHVSQVIWYDSVMDISIPGELLPDRLYQSFHKGDADLMLIIFDETTSADETMEAIEEIRSISNERCFLSGMSAIVTDTKKMAEKETPVYVCIAVALATIVLSLTMDSFLIPFFFLASIGMAILYNMGTNVFMGEISFITQSLSAVLQLGVTLDYSIFLWHSYQEELREEGAKGDKEKAMTSAITATFASVMGSSITTVAGFIALCFMSFRIGLDLGVVMAKGVVFGVLSCITILPSMILVFDRMLERTRHKPLLPEFDKIPRWIAHHYGVFGVAFLLMLAPAIWGYSHTSVYYDLTRTLPKSLPSVQAADELEANFDTNSTYVVLLDKNMSVADSEQLLGSMESVDGIDSVLGIDSILGPSFPREMIPREIRSKVEGDKYKLVLVNSRYPTASDEINAQIDTINGLVKSYDSGAMVVGEAPCTKDLITITNKDFNVVNWVSIGMVFLIIAFVLKSASLPFVLVAVIEFAIFINMGIPAYTGTTIPFIASVVIGTIQLGATVDYAILMTTRYIRERRGGQTKMEATTTALSTSMKSIIVSALSFFSATFGVGMISSIDMIGSLCNLMARGALISMAVVILVLPSMYMIFDGLICRTTSFKDKTEDIL